MGEFHYHHCSPPASPPPPVAQVPLPQSVENMIEKICLEKDESPPDSNARRKLAEIGEDKAYEIVRRIYYSNQPIRTDLSRYITWFVNSPKSPIRMTSSPPTPMPQSPTNLPQSPIKRGESSCSQMSKQSISSLLPHLESESPCSGMSKLSISFPLPHSDRASPSKTSATSLFSSKPEIEGSTSIDGISYQLMVLSSQLEFRKFFLLYSYIGRSKLEEVITPDDADKILKMKDFPMAVYELCIWDMCGAKNCDQSDRRMSIEWDSGKTHLYYCHVYLDGSYCFKGPYLNTIRTHLQRTLGDDNVLIVKFVEEGRYCTDRIFEEGIIVGLRRYRFFVFKDESKDVKKKKKGVGRNKTPVSASVKCYFVRFDSIATCCADEPYILSSLKVNEARSLFMHVHKVSSLAKYMPRFSLILSKTIKLPIDLSSVDIQTIQDEECRDENKNPILDEGGEPLILTDGTGFISEDLALKCPQGFGRAKYINDRDFQKLRDFVGFEDVPLEGKGVEARNVDPPLLIQCRLFSQGRAVKGTLLVNKKLKAGTIQIRSPSMVKVKKDETITIDQAFDSLEIVAISHRPRRSHLSKYLIALLSYGGVPRTVFVDLLTNALEEIDAVFTDKRAAFKVALNHEDFDDAGSAVRMMLAGIPLNEPHLQKRLSELAKTERILLKEGKLPITESFYLMGTADPTGLLTENQVCVILDHGPVSGEVLVYRNPGLHFGDVHVLEAVDVKELKDIIGNAKYGIFFSAKGQRSVASEIANGDFDGDMYWVSRNPQLLNYFKASKPWTRICPSQPAKDKKLNEFSDEQLEHELFQLFLETRKPSFNMALAADSWLSFMDRLLVLGDDSADEKDALKEKMLKLIDIYYDALDAPKSGKKIIVPEELKAERFPHYMGKIKSYHSTSVLGDIYDRIQVFQSEERSNGEIWKMPCFDVEIPEEYLSCWRQRYNDYRREMTAALAKDDESKKDAADDVIKKYKQLLYDASELQESEKNILEIYNEALAIYQVTYGYAISKGDPGKCGFAWRVAGSALLNIFASSRNEKLVPVSSFALRELLS